MGFTVPEGCVGKNMALSGEGRPTAARLPHERSAERHGKAELASVYDVVGP